MCLLIVALSVLEDEEPFREEKRQNEIFLMCNFSHNPVFSLRNDEKKNIMVIICIIREIKRHDEMRTNKRLIFPISKGMKRRE